MSVLVLVLVQVQLPSVQVQTVLLLVQVQTVLLMVQVQTVLLEGLSLVLVLFLLQLRNHQQT
jgi:hypothetical protein